MRNTFYEQNENSLKIKDAMILLEDLLNSKRHKDVMREIENIKLSNLG